MLLRPWSHDGCTVAFATDDWPFLCLRGRIIPDLTLRAVILTGAIGLIMVYLFLPKDRGAFNDGSRIQRRMFFGSRLHAGGRSLHSSTRNPDQAVGANVAGSAMGDFCEDFSMLLGSHLLLLAARFYLLSRLGQLMS